ncbi:MAG: N-acetyltransferase [Melioribacteraceae bacterium]
MKVKIRQEKNNDFKSVFNLIEKSFRGLEDGEPEEQFLVERLRKSDVFIPKLSLVAEYNDEIVGHILLTKIKIINDQNSFNSLALAPVAVLPRFQNQGIGGKLINEAHKIAKDLGYSSVVVLGHASYYPRFGYVQADKFGIELPFDVPKENCMAIELFKNGLDGVKGIVKYPKEFYE